MQFLVKVHIVRDEQIANKDQRSFISSPHAFMVIFTLIKLLDLYDHVKLIVRSRHSNVKPRWISYSTAGLSIARPVVNYPFSRIQAEQLEPRRGAVHMKLLFCLLCKMAYSCCRAPWSAKLQKQRRSLTKNSVCPCTTMKLPLPSL